VTTRINSSFYRLIVTADDLLLEKRRPNGGQRGRRLCLGHLHIGVNFLAVVINGTVYYKQKNYVYYKQFVFMFQ